MSNFSYALTKPVRVNVENETETELHVIYFKSPEYNQVGTFMKCQKIMSDAVSKAQRVNQMDMLKTMNAETVENMKGMDKIIEELRAIGGISQEEINKGLERAKAKQTDLISLEPIDAEEDKKKEEASHEEILDGFYSLIVPHTDEKALHDLIAYFKTLLTKNSTAKVFFSDSDLKTPTPEVLGNLISLQDLIGICAYYLHFFTR